MALAERLLAARFGDELVDHHTYVIVGDGCLMEGVSHEAISLAGHLRLNRLIVLFDDNHVSIDGPTALAVGDDQIARFRASAGVPSPSTVMTRRLSRRRSRAAADTERPSLIACRTTIGYRRSDQGRNRCGPRRPARRRRRSRARASGSAGRTRRSTCRSRCWPAWRDSAGAARRERRAWAERHARQAGASRVRAPRCRRACPRHSTRRWSTAKGSLPPRRRASPPAVASQRVLDRVDAGDARADRRLGRS